MELIIIKNANMVILINLLILFSKGSIIPSLKITAGKMANKPIMIIIMTTQKALINSANE
jgi:hypothetical protein